jgi:hypothetical protein
VQSEHTTTNSNEEGETRVDTAHTLYSLICTHSPTHIDTPTHTHPHTYTHSNSHMHTHKTTPWGHTHTNAPEIQGD